MQRVTEPKSGETVLSCFKEDHRKTLNHDETPVSLLLLLYFYDISRVCIHKCLFLDSKIAHHGLIPVFSYTQFDTNLQS